MIPFYWNQVEKIDQNDVLIDVRTKEENQKGTIPRAVNIPLDELRINLKKIPSDKSIYVFCEVGQRAYLAQQILNQSGFNKVFNLSGGYYSWKNCNAESVHHTEAGFITK